MRLSAFSLVIGFLLTLAPPSLAQNLDSRVNMPGLQKGAVAAGCYSADRELYGRYRLHFCLEPNGTYRVTGPQLRCDGQLAWKAQRRDVAIALRRKRCNGGVAWTAADISCRPNGYRTIAMSELFGDRNRGGRVLEQVKVPVVRQMRCTYQPSGQGLNSLTFFAVRN
ncbi:MAG: hypothetical protein R3E44_06540 [Paracoccaceae bacterium]